ncbi:hypothetical protein POJ06DRAFT_21172 [Lipomyces tetrasporus]|uniref:Uncharacterized protein n=1 Tax=Lipomyces tetrasporus TaxID=54092 RepID=A0AAD7QM04_9ASCO|nr:uncharacterized protein POJ06DRAFT_21172 [Lipomyces tetrasporus]KAJ8097767.1 hypothetical protein POJ06DRAFT_21172 [Lipomyces tetrasporus]
MDAIETRVAKLEHYLALVQTSTSSVRPHVPGISVIEHLASLFQSIQSLVQEDSILQKYLALDPNLVDDKRSKRAPNEAQAAHQTTIALAHSNDIAYLSSSLPTVTSLAEITLNSPQVWIRSVEQAFEVTALHGQMIAVEQEAALLIVRSVALFERLLARSVAGANQAWAEIEDRLGAIDRSIRRYETSLIGDQQ